MIIWSYDHAITWSDDHMPLWFFNKHILTKIWSCRASKKSRGIWFWRLKLSSSAKIQEKWRKTNFRDKKKYNFLSNRFFVVLGVVKRHRRLGFWRRVAFDFPNAPKRPKIQKRAKSMFFDEFPENFRDRRPIAGSVACAKRRKCNPRDHRDLRSRR